VLLPSERVEVVPVRYDSSQGAPLYCIVLGLFCGLTCDINIMLR
jgi:hypothetical protein